MLTPQERVEIEALRKRVKSECIGHTLHGGRRDPNGEPEGVVQHPGQLMVSAATQLLTKDIADVLTKRWPGFRWAIQPNEAGKVFNLFCLDFHSRWGYVIRYDDVMNDPRRRQAILAGRAILKRFRYHGDRYDPVQLAHMPRDAQGECYPDVQGLKRTRFTRQAELGYKLKTGDARVVMQRDRSQIIEVKE